MIKKKIDGLSQAVAMLQGLDPAAQESLICEIARKDPELAVKIRERMLTFEDLRFITVGMFKRLLQEIQLDTLGLALRGASKGLTEHLLAMVSSNLKRDIEDVLKGRPCPLGQVLDAQKKIMDAVIMLRDRGEIILSKDKSDKFV
jgi:flagellar motor switch protein FliG